MTLRNTTIRVQVNRREFDVELVPDQDPFDNDKSSYCVWIGWEKIGKVFRREFTREIGPRGRRYVTKRWYSYGWTYSSYVRDGWGSPLRLEQPTRQRAVESLVREHLEKQGALS